MKRQFLTLASVVGLAGCSGTVSYTADVRTMQVALLTHRDRGVSPSVSFHLYEVSFADVVSAWFWEFYDAEYSQGRGIAFVVGHGWDFEGEWYLWSSDDRILIVREIVDDVRKQYPGDVIVLIVCNPGGYVLDTPGVAYAKNDIWVLPDSRIDTEFVVNARRQDNVTGQASEFVFNPF
jgi:hypothetical protein